MDEPTTSLTLKEIDNVFAIMRGLTTDHGVSIIFISHKLGEVVDFCDSYTVLRNGEKVADGYIMQPDGTKISQADIARMMVGRDVLGVEVYKPHDIGDVVLEVKDLTVDTRVKGISFDLRKGEILGLTGLLGDGKDELVRALFGDLQKSGGSVTLKGKPLNIKHPSQGKKCGIGFLPSNRKENAIIKDLSVQENITIVTLDKCCAGPTLMPSRERKVAEEYREKLGIKVANLANKITSLSGGNQQKVVLAKWLYNDADILILDEPTRGIDVGAKYEIYVLMNELVKQGKAVIMISSELPEIFALSDRILVMYEGQIKTCIENYKDLRPEDIMKFAIG
jgi:ribose transport system ATP-binding protein